MNDQYYFFGADINIVIAIKEKFCFDILAVHIVFCNDYSDVVIKCFLQRCDNWGKMIYSLTIHFIV